MFVNRVAFANEKSGTTKSEKRIVNEKLQVLRDFCIVDNRNEDEFRRMFISAIHENPQNSPEAVVDRLAKKLIAEKLS